MRHLVQLFTSHPASVGESYFEHLRMASGFGSRMVLGGLACLIHGVLPFLFERTARTQIERLHHQVVVARDRRPPPAETARSASS